MDLKKLGEELKKRRQASELTLEQAGAIVGEHKQHLSSIERGTRSISFERMKEIFNKLGYSIEVSYKIKKEKVK